MNNAAAEDEALAAISRCLAQNQKDLPFALTYLFTEEGKRAKQ